MVDIATLAVTIPHRRKVSFWAKASMFKHPFTRFIMVSSGAIPVRRNPNNLSSNSTSDTSSTTLSPTPQDELTARAALFKETIYNLKKGGTIGIFPEGTSCTGWRVFQTMPGAAWAALEYTRAEGGKGKDTTRGFRIVPVAITYTDKAKYLSRVSVCPLLDMKAC